MWGLEGRSVCECVLLALVVPGVIVVAVVATVVAGVVKGSLD